MWKFIYFSYIIIQFMPSFAFVSFTNFKCQFDDNNFGDFSKCNIKAVNRTHKYLELHANLYQLPIDNITIHLRAMRFSNGYKPFFIDVTFDACKFLKNQKNPFIKVVYDLFKQSSNMNHTCPYNHDLIVDKLWSGNIESDFTRFLPVTNGRYAIYMDFYTYNIHRSTINTYLTIS